MLTDKYLLPFPKGIMPSTSGVEISDESVYVPVDKTHLHIRPESVAIRQ